MANPGAFPAFKAQSPFTVKIFIYTLTTATYQSAVTYFLAHGMFYRNDIINPNGHSEGMAVMGNMMITSVVITTNLTMLLALSSINYVNILAMVIGFILYMVVFIFEAAAYQISLAPDGFGMGLPIFGVASTWLYFILSAILCLLPNALFECWQKLYHPRYFQLLQHMPLSMIEQRQEQEANEVEAKRLAEIKTKEITAAALANEKAGRRRPVITRLPGGTSESFPHSGGETEMAAFRIHQPLTPGMPPFEYHRRTNSGGLKSDLLHRSNSIDEEKPDNGNFQPLEPLETNDQTVNNQNEAPTATVTDDAATGSMAFKIHTPAIETESPVKKHDSIYDDLIRTPVNGHATPNRPTRPIDSLISTPQLASISQQAKDEPSVGI